MAITAPRRRPKDPEGRMPLGEHLRELRTRVFRAGVAIIIASVAGWFMSRWLIAELQHPLKVANAAHPELPPAKLNITDPTGSFNLQVRTAVYAGIALSAPVWLYQVWAFIVPGLTKRERRYTYGFMGSAVPLFAAGLALGWFVLPNAVTFFTSFTPKDASAQISSDLYFAFVTRLMLAFGIAFVVPLLLVALNLVGLMGWHTMAKGWRIAVFACFLFAGMASPTPDISMMMLLALPMIGLYLVAVAIAYLVDRRRARRLDDLHEDEASDIDGASPLERLEDEIL